MSSRRLSVSARRIQLKKTAEHIDKCDKERDDCFNRICSNQEEYDKQILTLSSGFLGLSVAFIKDIVPTQTAIHRGLLYSSFVVLIVCILSVLFSFQLSNAAQTKAMQWWDNQHDQNDDTPFPYGHAKIVEVLNWASGLLFFVGITLAVSFVIVNLHNEAKMTHQVCKTVDGGLVKTPAPDRVEKGAPVKLPTQQQKPPAAPPAKK